MNLADKLSVLRILLIPIFLSLIIYCQFFPFLKNIAVIIFLIAVISDFLDGLAARIQNKKSQFGQIIDPLADKLLMFSSFIALYLLRKVLPLNFQMPPGIVIVVAARDIIILLGVIVLYSLKCSIAIKPSIWGKLTTFFQMFTILAILTNMPIFPWLWKIALGFTLFSGIGYFLQGLKTVNVKDNSFTS